MQVVEVANEGLKRAFSVTVPAGTIAEIATGACLAWRKGCACPAFAPARCHWR